MKEFTNQIQNKFIEMQKTGKLFRVKITGSELWSIYLNSFSKEHNPTFRDPASSEHNCNHCHNFIKRYGNIVAVDDKLNIVTMFDVYPAEEYKNTAYQLRDAIEKSIIGDVFFETYALIEDNEKPDAEIELKKLKFDIVNDILQGKVKERTHKTQVF